MTVNVYTLLIVESPTIAKIIQELCPASVYVLSTEGFCWRPAYRLKENRLKAIADPNKRELRREIREQSQAASNIIIAVDSDPSGDFIAWSLCNFIRKPNIQGARLNSLSKKGIVDLLENTDPIDPLHLESRLKNRFLIRKLWSNSPFLPDIQLAGITAVFGTNQFFQHFLDEENRLYRSTRPFRCPADEWITIRKTTGQSVYRNEKPLSTFDLIEETVRRDWSESYYDAQQQIQSLFQSVLPISNESLISYPRTNARAFYSETWENLTRQSLKFESVNALKPAYLREIAAPELPHESIHPISLAYDPEKVSGEMPEEQARLYSIIYDHTLKSVQMPAEVEYAYYSELSPDVQYYPLFHDQPEITGSLRPCLTLSDLGHALNDLGVAKPSRFGREADQWIDMGWIRLENSVVKPGKKVLETLKKAKIFRQKLDELNRLKEKAELNPETVSGVISS